MEVIMKRFLSYLFSLIVVVQSLNGSEERIAIESKLAELRVKSSRCRMCLDAEMGHLRLLGQVQLIMQEELKDVLTRRNGGRKRSAFGELKQSDLQATDPEEQEIYEQVVMCKRDTRKSVIRIDKIERKIQAYEIEIKKLIEKLNS